PQTTRSLQSRFDRWRCIVGTNERPQAARGRGLGKQISVTITITTMHDKKTLIVGNWKMHLNVQQSSLLVHRLSERIKVHRGVEVVLAPSMLALQPLSLQIDRRKFRLSA